MLPPDIKHRRPDIGDGYGPRPLNSTRRHGHFLKSICDMEPSDMRKKIKGHDMGYFLNSTGDMRAC